MEKKEKEHDHVHGKHNLSFFFQKKKCSLLENFSTYKKIIKSEESKNDCLLRLLKQQRPTSLSSFNDYPSAIFSHFLSVSQIISPTGFTHRRATQAQVHPLEPKMMKKNRRGRKREKKKCIHSFVIAYTIGIRLDLSRPSLSRGGTFFSSTLGRGTVPINPLLSASSELRKYCGSSW